MLTCCLIFITIKKVKVMVTVMATVMVHTATLTTKMIKKEFLSELKKFLSEKLMNNC